jgi:hypothetical protein
MNGLMLKGSDLSGIYCEFYADKRVELVHAGKVKAG